LKHVETIVENPDFYLSVTNSKAKTMCNQILFLLVMQMPFLKRVISYSKSNKCQITSIPFTNKTKKFQNQKEFLGLSIVSLKA
jgi:hypothetical protein